MTNVVQNQQDNKVAAQVFSSEGSVSINKSGYVLTFDENVDSYFKDILRFDLVEQAVWWGKKTGNMPQLESEYDVLDLGYWKKDGTYIFPDFLHRNTIVLTHSELLEDKLKVEINHETKELSLIYGYKPDLQSPWEAVEIVNLKFEQYETWLFTRINNIDIAVDFRYDEGVNISIYTFSKPMEDILRNGESSVNHLGEELKPVEVSEIGHYA